MDQPVYIDRPPRIQPELPFDEIQIPAPPDKPEDGNARLIQVALPLLTIVGYVLIGSISGGGGRNALFIIPMAFTVVAAAAFSVYSLRKEKQRQAELERAYSDRLTELNKEMHVYHDMQRRFYGYNYPDRLTTFRIVHHARTEVEKEDRTLRSESRLWERRASDEDFGVVRLGMGTLPSTVTYVFNNTEKFEDPQVREALKLANDSLFVPDVPVMISLRQPYKPEGTDEEEEVKAEEEKAAEEASVERIPTTHALGIAGEAESVYEFVRAMLGHYVVFHAPMDAKLYVLASRKQEWTWAQNLPHSRKDDQNQYLCFVEDIKTDDEADRAFDDDDEGAIAQFLEGIRKILAQRKIRLQDRDQQSEAKEDPTLPFMLVVIDLLEATYDSDSPLTDLEADAAISILLAEGAALGAAVVFLVPERSKVPSSCLSVVEIEKTTPATNSKLQQFQKLHFRYAEVGVNTFRYVGEADYIAKLEEMSALSRALAQLEVRKGFGANLASVVPFMDLMGYNSMQALETDTWRKWQDSIEARYANWLRAKIGLMSGNKPRTLVFSAKRDGVHGMVAGSTGSGKSELLISLITFMAVTYDPTVLNFVLVDYKGGGAFKGFDELPHCVDIITNLAGEGVTRMFTAIKSEMYRRQALNVETETKNIVEYRQKGFHKKHYPYPFLFIIIDEFAEMIADRAEYRSELETITRVGRAQGVSLLLAAQRPSGVTDQMRSNIKFRICLRVETTGESREMLRRSDAAFLPNGIPGRGFLQVGNDEIELIQSAYTGDKYIDRDQAAQAPVIWPERGGQPSQAQDQEPPELYKAIVALLDKMSDEHRVEKQYAPWPNFLPAHLSLSETLISPNPAVEAVTSERYLIEVDKITLGRERESTLTLNPAVNRWLEGDNGWVEPLDWENYALRPVVGLVDNPYAAKQLPLIIDLPRGHWVIFGASGWGKTTFVRSLVVSLAASHSPGHVHMYLLDLGGRSLGVLANLPHVGSVIIPDEEGYKERVEQLLRELEELVEQRKTIFNNAGVPDLYTYNKANPSAPLPAVVVAIDNFIEFKETFGSENDNVESVLDKYVALMRQSKAYGIHFVITVNQMSVLSSQLYSVLTERMTLKLADHTEYRTIVGAAVADIGDTPGRGYVKEGNLALSCQVALPLDLRREGVAEVANETRELEQFAQNMHDFITASGYKYQPPRRIDALPKALLFKQILARQLQLDLDEKFLGRLKEATAKKWQDSLDPKQADWLKVTMGVISGNRLREMHLEAKKDGVHGMIAGGTGAGKSELLMTLIVGLALNYDPSVLNFLLVDYKGGGAFQPFRDLPHCVDIITNLNKSAVRRMFTAINAEMQRRQKLNADTATKDIVEYRAKGLHLSHEPYPHLFIIIDEYAEMISDSPEFKNELESITRVGRAQGVNLLLASQRPVGVTDQMRANIKLRLCLRVEQVDTSREMLRRSDAAFLPNGMPGRGYLQVGNENIELIQVAYTGENYEYAEVREGGRQPKFYDMVVDMCNELLQGERPRTPWPPFLPAKLTMSSPLVEAYMDTEYQPLLTLGHYQQLTPLNPFIGDWLQGQVGWYGVNWTKTAMRAIVGLVDDPYNAAQLPLLIDFNKGHVVLFGASGWGKTTFMRSLVVTLAATHSPAEFHAHVLLGGTNLEVLRALPHVGTIIMPDERGYEERVQQILRELNDIVDERKRLFSEAGVSTLYEYNSSHPQKIEPAILVILDNFTEFLETFGGEGNQDSENNLLEAFVMLVRQAKAFGLHFIISVNRLNELNSKLYSLFTERLTLRLSDANDYRSIVGGNVGEIDEIPGRGYVKVGRQPLEFQVAISVGNFDEQGQLKAEAQQIRFLGQQMKELGRKAWSGKEPLRIDALPKSSSYRQVLSEVFGLNPENSFLDELKAAMQRKWAVTGSAEQADWLYGVLGITSGNRKRTMHLSAKTDGVHGMIAGGTGSGKSEMLMTLIVGLVVYHSPDILNFVLVDYKGGGAFKPFEKLPHVVDIVTNLNKAAVNRMFTAINAEIRRRQALNADTGTKDIVEYRARGLHLTGPAYPHLFIIIDEYAEMIDDNPEYRAELESITRVGRAQGVNLVLASQRPKGVSDQMRANIKLRICLRVEQIDTSREMLRSPDAAFLPNGMPGRGYLQIGNENLELIQVSFTGENQPDERPAAVLWPDRPAQEVAMTGEDTPKLFDAVVRLSSELVDHRMAPKPWPAFLPRQFSLQSLMHDAQKNEYFILSPVVTDWLNDDTDGLWSGVDWRKGAMRPVMGLLDNPAEAKQEPLIFDLSRTHLVVMGDSGWGKTSFLRSLIVSLATTHSPNEFQVYVFDLGGRNFRSLEDLPHMGTVVYADEEVYEERMQRLLDKLTNLVDERQQILSNADASNLYDYNERYPEQSLPAMLVAIDNFAELYENYESLVESTIVPLVRRSLSMGITFVVTCNVPNNMPSKLYNLFGERITFKQSNTDRYMDIVGRGAIEIDEIPGRGYIRVGKQPLLFQVALPVGIFSEEDGRDRLPEGDELRLLARNMRRHLEAGKTVWRHQPDPINILPELVSLQEMLAQADSLKSGRIQAVLGQDSGLKPALFDLKRMGPHFAIAGPPLSGKTTLLYDWVLSLADRYPPDRVKMVLVDFQRKFVEYDGQHKLSDLPHVLSAISEVEELEALLPRLKAECEIMTTQGAGHELFIIIDNYDDLSEEIERARDLPRELAGLARRYGRDGLHYIIAGTLDNMNELRKRVQAANYGIGLRSAQAVEALKVMRPPAQVRNKELQAGRGFIVKSGQATMIQVAAPYEVMAAVEELENQAEKVAQGLDKWVEKIQAKYPEQQATWSNQTNGSTPAQMVTSQQNARTIRMMNLLQRSMQKELAHLGEGNGTTAELITAKLVQMDIGYWNNADMLLQLLKEVWVKEKRANGLPDDLIQTLSSILDEESLLLEVEAAVTQE